MKNIEEQIKDLLKEDPYELKRSIKKKKLLEIFKLQIHHHIQNCQKYKYWYKENKFINPVEITDLSQIPYIPSSVFKFTELISSKSKIKIIRSSGSTSNNKSSIYLDSVTSNLQKISLSKILSSTLNKKRKIFFIIDVEPKENFSQNTITARYAGMSGYLMAAKSKNYLLKINKNNQIVFDNKIVSKLIKKIKNEPIVLIGYTYMLWNYFLENNYLNTNKIVCHPDSQIIHFGGWKKLQNKSVTKQKFIEKILKLFKIKLTNILDIYGFSEQLGSIYVSRGVDGCAINSYSHIIIRDPQTLNVVKDGQLGFMQFLSILPTSYPGFSILNDDIGYISSRKIVNNVEKIEFKIQSRLDKLEPRGCGDTLPNHYYI